MLAPLLVSLEIDDGRWVEELLPLGFLHRREASGNAANLLAIAGPISDRLRQAEPSVQPHPQAVHAVAQEVDDKHEKDSQYTDHNRLARLLPVEHPVDTALVVPGEESEREREMEDKDDDVSEAGRA